MSQYFFTLDSVKLVLQTKDPSRVNIAVAIACIFNSYAWTCYALVVNDIFVLMPNIAAFFCGLIQLCLYFWTTGSLTDQSIIIKYLHKIFADPRQKVLPRKLKTETEIDFE